MPRDLQLEPDPPGAALADRAAVAESKVFEDLGGRRRTRFVVILAMVVVLLAAWAGEFWWRVYRLEPASPLAAAALVGEGAAGGPAPSRPLAGAGCGAPAPEAGAPRVFAYLPAGDAKARAGLSAACGRVDAVLTDALVLEGDGRVAAAAAAAAPDADLPPAYLIARPAAGLSTDRVEALMLGPPGAARIAEALVAAGRAADAPGVCLTLAGHPAAFVGALRRLMAEWAPRARAAGQETCLIAGARAGFWRDGATLAATDRAVLLAFEVTGQPYAPAPRAFLDDVVAPLARSLPAGKLVLVPGSFGLMWQSGAREPEMLSYADSMLWADRHGAEVGFSDEAGNSRIAFIDAERRRNQIWLMDAVSFGDALAALPAGAAVGLWPLGYEDPGVWDLLAGAGLPSGPVVLDQIAALGTGPFVTGAEPARPGQRTLTWGDDGRVSAVGYDRLPLPARTERAGGAGLGVLALTFDGLPEPAALPALLGALAERDIHATFFATPDALLKGGEVARALLAAGHGLGSTVYSLDESWPGAALVRQLGLNRMQLQLADEAGRRTVFVRDGSRRLANPTSAADLDALAALVAAGYLPVEEGLRLPGFEATPAERLDLVRRGVLDRGTNLVTVDLSDGAAGPAGWLPGLLDTLARDGFGFVGLDSLAQSPAPLGALPAGGAAVGRDAVSFAVLGSLTGKLGLLFIVMLSLDATRSLIYLTLAFQRRRQAVLDPDFRPGVTVLVPAYNEEDVIDRCLASVTRSDYPNLRILVIDDGSTDRTAEIVRQNWLHDPRISLISQSNAGKCHAANHALEHVVTPIFVGIDADTIVAPDAISWLVQQFRDPKVGAISGFVEVGNRCNFLTRAQAVEYIVSQSVGRRAFDVINGILVVPGAIGAWRTAAVEAAGRYSGNTITEDADLTVAIHRAGYRVRFEEHAHAYTEAPIHVAPLVKQRIRWALGMLQTSWKHRGAIREGRAVGVISIVDAIWISFLSSLAAPIVDVLLIVLGLKAAWTLATVGLAAVNVAALVAILGYFSLVIVDTATAAAAFALDRRRDWGLIALVPLLRFGYRQIMVFAALSALVRAITGRLYGWNKLSRTGTVSLPAPVLMPGE